MKTFIGIDPGKTGGIVALDSKGNIKHKMETPTIGKEYNTNHMVSMLQAFEDPHVILENINGHVAKGRTTAFIMGEGKGMWRGILAALMIPHTLITPQVWQKEMWQGIPVQKKANKRKDTKAMSLLAAQRLFPGADLRKSEKSSNPHDGIVDALLLAEYGRRMYTK